MFTGIIEETGTIRHISRESNSARLSVAAARVLEGTSEGDSIAVNGVCLTDARRTEIRRQGESRKGDEG